MILLFESLVTVSELIVLLLYCMDHMQSILAVFLLHSMCIVLACYSYLQLYTFGFFYFSLVYVFLGLVSLTLFSCNL